MSFLNASDKELLLDYCFGCLDEEQKQKAQDLIGSNPQAAEIYNSFKSSLSPLSSMDYDNCPDYLVERTVLRLNNEVSNSQLQLEKLLQREQQKSASTVKWGFFKSFAEMAAIAAVVLVIAGVSFPALRSMRQLAWQDKCQAQLLNISRGISDYSADHSGTLPAVAVNQGSPWWKVGDQGADNQSNTRHLWILVKDGYVQGADFVCPARTEGRALQLQKSHISSLMDFPNRKYVTYSFKLINSDQPNINVNHSSNRILMADMNPVFERMYDSLGRCNQAEAIELCEKLRQQNSSNHAGKGQNVLFSDGSINFVKTRTIGFQQDDIYTIEGHDTYLGCETPKDSFDTFLVP